MSTLDSAQLNEQASEKKPTLHGILYLGINIVRNIFFLGCLEAKAAGINLCILLSLGLLIVMALFSIWSIAMFALSYHLYHLGISLELIIGLICSIQLVFALLLSLLIYTSSKRSFFPATRAAIQT